VSTDPKKPAKQSLVVDDDNAEKKVLTTEQKNTSTNSPSSSSTQKQLLVLAKQFVLDGAMIPESKQMPLEDRALRRDRIYLLRKQQNLESIIQKSLAYCPSSSSSTRADPDWFSQFTVLAEDVSNNTMQDLWAKILAGEIAQPGSYSLKSLSIFKSMSITDAKLLAKVCSLVVKDSSKKNTRILSGAYQTPGFWSFFKKSTQSKVNLNQCDVSYTELLSLAENNIIFIQEAESNELNKGEKVTFNFNGQNLVLTAKANQCVLNFYKFTPVGSELALLISDNPHKEFLPLLKTSLKPHFSVNVS
jgi:uncharacterized repeat protein (TIGR03899 family)